MSDGKLSVGSLEIPEGFECHVEATLRAPEGTATDGDEAEIASRPTLFLVQRRATTDPDAYLEKLLGRIAAKTPGMTVDRLEPFVFANATRGTCFRVELPSIPPLTQLHVSRVDDGLLTHLSVVTGQGDEAALDDLRAALATWVPPATEP